jgi:two-component system OmpR family response regulator
VLLEDDIFLVETSPTSPGTLVGVRVLVVEDDRDCRELFRTLLEMSGAQVATAAGAYEGLREFLRRRPDVVVSDFSMPDQDGCWLMRRLQTAVHGGERRPAAIAVTAYRDEGVREQCRAAGFDVVLSKPIDPAEFCVLIERLVRSPARAERANDCPPDQRHADRTSRFPFFTQSEDVCMARGRAEELQGIHVLVVDDDEQGRYFVCAVLEFWGAVVTATPAAEALGAALTADVIVCDLQTAATAGPTFLEGLRRLHTRTGRRVPAIALVPMGMDPAAFALSPDFHRWLSKPVNGTELRLAVRDLARG